MKENKKAVSLILSYVLLIVIGLSLAAVVYPFLKSRISVGGSLDNCNDQVALVLKDYYCNSTEIILKLENKGLFNIDGFLIRGSNEIDKLATIGLSRTDMLAEKGAYQFAPELKPSEVIETRFNYKDAIPLKKVEIQPYIIKDKNRNTCPNIFSFNVDASKGCITEGTAPTCTPKTCENYGYICGSHLESNCKTIISCGTCGSGLECNGLGKCVAEGSCTDSCSSLGYECGSQTICEKISYCGTCDIGKNCNTQGKCITQARVLVQEGDRGKIGIWYIDPVSYSISSGLWISDNSGAYQALAIDGNNILIQNGVNGIIGLWSINSSSHIFSGVWIANEVQATGVIARDIEGSKVLIQNGNTGKIGIWYLDLNKAITSVSWVSNNNDGYIARALSGNKILVQSAETAGKVENWYLKSDETGIDKTKTILTDKEGITVEDLDDNKILTKNILNTNIGIWQIDSNDEYLREYSISDNPTNIIARSFEF